MPKCLPVFEGFFASGTLTWVLFVSIFPTWAFSSRLKSTPSSHSPRRTPRAPWKKSEKQPRITRIRLGPRNRYAAFYAEEYRDSGGATWGGTGNNWYLIPDTAFNQCYVSGTFDSGSRDDIWDNEGQNDALAQNWANIVAANWATAQATANGDLAGLVNSLIGTLGTVLGIVAIVVA